MSFNLRTNIHTTTPTTVPIVEAAFGHATTITCSFVDGTLADIQWHEHGRQLAVNPITTLVSAQKLLASYPNTPPVSGTITFTLE